MWFCRLVIISLLFCGCYEDDCYCNWYKSITDYNVSGKYFFSPAGIKIYPNNNTIKLQEIDKKVEELEECLNIKVKRDCFIILIPDDWYISSCSGEELLPVSAPYYLCEDKNIRIEESCRWLDKPTKECPCVCAWRSAIQDDHILVLTPNLKMLKLELTRLTTGVNNPWIKPELYQCLH